MTVRPTTALRLGAALAVMASHAVPITTGSNDAEWVWRVSQHQATLGGIAVAVFFVVSGYLITGSYARRADPVRFIQARALRLLPGLAVMLALIALIAGPLLTTLPVGDYFSDPGVPRFVAGNLSVFAFTTGLPGLFASNPFPDAVNGSLWTLAYEVDCYAAVLLLGACGLLRRWPVLVLYGALLLASKMWWGGRYVEFGSYFAGGAALFFWPLPLRRWMATGCVALLLTSLAVGGFRLVAATAGAYLVIYAALALRPIKMGGADLSYGVYIYAFPVQQAAVLLLGGPAWANILASVPPVLALAWAS